MFAIIFLSVYAAIIQDKYLKILYSMLGAILYGLFLGWDTRFILGKTAIKYNIDD